MFEHRPFEHRHAKPLPLPAFMLRVLRRIGLALPILVVSLGIGMVGYMGIEHMSWEDAFLNAAMLLGGMGPVGELHTNTGKIFAGLYALYSGVVFLIVAGVVLSPFIHRVLHYFHWETDRAQQ